MSICLALAAAAALSTSSPAVQTAPTPSSPHVVQYVQVQYRNVLKQNIVNNASQMLGSTLHAQFGAFLSNVLRSALSHANPILGAIANMVANKVTAQLTSIPIDIHPKPNIHVVAEFEATTSIAPARSRTDIGPLSTIIQCDKQQIIVVDNSAKVYTVTSFSDSLNDADAGPGFGPFSGGSVDASQQIVQPQPDDGTETIAGLVSHHQLITSPMTSGFGAAKTDYWFADLPLPNTCASTPQQPGIVNLPTAATTASTIRIPLRNVQWSEMDFSGSSPAASPSPAASAMPSSYRDPVLQTPGIAWIETTSVTMMSYDPSYFDVPVGYTQATPEPSPSPS